MIGLTEIGCYIPSQRNNNLEQEEKFELERGFLSEKLGVLKTSLKADNESTSDLCVNAFKNLEKRLGYELNNIDCLVVCTQNPDGNGIPHTSAVVHKKLALDDNCAVFDISLGCSGYVYGLAIIEGLMKAQGFTKGLLFTADPYSKIIDKTDKNTCLLFGDAATVTLISDKPVFESIAYKMATKGSSGRALHNDHKKLEMDGRAVFTFALTEVPKQIHSLLEETSVTLEQIDLFLLHQGSKFMIEKLTERLGDVKDKTPFDITEHGNTVSSSIPLLLQNYLDKADKNTVLLSGFGVGLSWASTILRRVN
jgi:3-oxoacyl-[acyl-carrier-protein] synthase-3